MNYWDIANLFWAVVPLAGLALYVHRLKKAAQ